MNLTVDDLLHQLEGLPPGRAAGVFEALVLRYIAALATSEGRPFSVASSKQWDALLPEGIDEHSGPIYVEVKYTRFGRRPIMRWMEDFRFRLSHSAETANAQGLLIFNGNLSAEQRVRYSSLLDMLPSGPPVHLWDRTRLLQLAAQFPKVLSDAVHDAPFGALAFLTNESTAPTDQDWKDTADERLALVKARYDEAGLTLFLGAGVSIAEGIPSWDGLLAKLHIALAEQEFSHAVPDPDVLSSVAAMTEELVRATPLLTARYLRAGLDLEAGVAAFRQRLTQILYEDLHPDERGPLLQAIGNMCQPRRSGARVHAAITFNFDDLLEQTLSERQLAHQAVYLPHMVAGRDDLPVHHVHGFLPRETSVHPDVEKSLLTFSEEGYHALYRDAFHWSNIVQLNALRESCCVFIGMSVSDPNLRRLLEAARTDTEPRHYAFLARTSSAELARLGKRRTPPVKLGAEQGNLLLQAHHRLTEQMLGELGVRVIWYSHHDDLPRLLNLIVSS